MTISIMGRKKGLTVIKRIGKLELDAVAGSTLSKEEKRKKSEQDEKLHDGEKQKRETKLKRKKKKKMK